MMHYRVKGPSLVRRAYLSKVGVKGGDYWGWGGGLIGVCLLSNLLLFSIR